MLYILKHAMYVIPLVRPGSSGVCGMIAMFFVSIVNIIHAFFISNLFIASPRLAAPTCIKTWRSACRRFSSPRPTNPPPCLALPCRHLSTPINRHCRRLASTRFSAPRIDMSGPAAPCLAERETGQKQRQRQIQRHN
jgi:hypothetical protein